MIPYGKQSVSNDDIEAVIEILRSDFITQGPAVVDFEKKIASYCGAQHAIAVNSATSALHIACLALGLGPGDVLWTSPITFVASANCALYCGAKVDFVDVDRKTYNLSVDALEEKLQSAEKEGVLPKIVVPVHFAGQSCDMQRISELSQKYGFKILEDASHAIGGEYKNQKIGSCRYSDITVFSFHPVKIITTGEGGMAVTNDGNIADHMARLRSHGVTRNPEWMSGEMEGSWVYQQIELGFNFRMTDIQAALGISQMQRLDSFVAKRHRLREQYDQLLEEFPVIRPWQSSEVYSALHLYPIQIDLDRLAVSRRVVFDRLKKDGVGVNVHYIPVHTQPWYRNMGFRAGDYPEAEKYYERAITLPLFPELEDVEQEYVVNALARALQ